MSSLRQRGRAQQKGQDQWKTITSALSPAYPELFAAMGTTALPDLRGEFIRGWDHGRGIDAGRAILASQDDQNKAHSHGYKRSNGNGGEIAIAEDNNFTGRGPRTEVDSLLNSSGGGEARPRNVALMYLMRILP